MVVGSIVLPVVPQFQIDTNIAVISKPIDTRKKLVREERQASTTSSMIHSSPIPRPIGNESARKALQKG
jgi:hypothetical protein